MARLGRKLGCSSGERCVKIDWEGGISKAGAIVGLLSGIFGILLWIGIMIWNLTAKTEMSLALQQLQISNNSQAIKEESSKREQDEKNFDDILLVMGKMHERR